MSDFLADAPASATSADVDTLRIGKLEPADHTRWDDYVMACPEATFFHRAGWQTVIQRAFGHRSYFLYAERGGKLRGVLPLGHIKSLLFGNALISTPFCVYGGVAADDDMARNGLIDAACRLAEELGVDHLELRHRVRRRPDWPGKEGLYDTFRKSIDPDPEVNLKAIPRKQRAMVRKGIQAELQANLETGVERLFTAYSESVRNLGTPVFPRRYFEVLREVFGEDCEVLSVTQQDTLVAAVMNFKFRDEILPYYGGGTEAARAVKGNDFMYWEVMRRAGEAGYRVFDYGRSKRGTGAHSFKKNWGFEPEPLHYEYYLVKAREVPDINPLNPKYRLFINLWKRLPLPLSQALGPLLSRDLG